MSKTTQLQHNFLELCTRQIPSVECPAYRLIAQQVRNPDKIKYLKTTYYEYYLRRRRMTSFKESTSADSSRFCRDIRNEASSRKGFALSTSYRLVQLLDYSNIHLNI